MTLDDLARRVWHRLEHPETADNLHITGDGFSVWVNPALPVVYNGQVPDDVSAKIRSRFNRPIVWLPTPSEDDDDE